MPPCACVRLQRHDPANPAATRDRYIPALEGTSRRFFDIFGTLITVCEFFGTLMVVWKTFGALIVACAAFGTLMVSPRRASAALDSASAATQRVTLSSDRFMGSTSILSVPT